MCLWGALSVVFNVYGPRAVADDADRVEFKHRFYDVLEVSLVRFLRMLGTSRTFRVNCFLVLL